MLMDLDARRCYELLYLATQMRKARNEIFVSSTIKDEH